MVLWPLYIYYFFSVLEAFLDVCKRQNLTYKDGPRTKRVRIHNLDDVFYFSLSISELVLYLLSISKRVAIYCMVAMLLRKYLIVCSCEGFIIHVTFRKLSCICEEFPRNAKIII